MLSPMEEAIRNNVITDNPYVNNSEQKETTIVHNERKFTLKNEDLILFLQGGNRFFKKGDRVNWYIKGVLYFGTVQQSSKASAINVSVRYKNNTPISGTHCVQNSMLIPC